MKTQSLNIALISYYYFPEYSGSAIQAHNLIKRLRNFGLNFLILSAQLDPTWPKRESQDGTEIVRIPVGKNRSIFSFWLGVGIELLKRRSSIHVVHLNGLKPAHGFPAWISFLLGKPCIGKLSIAESDINFQRQGKILGKLHKWFLTHMDKYIAISTALQSELSNVGLSSNKSLLIPNGVDTEIYHPISLHQQSLLRRQLGFRDEFIVLFVGVVDHRKGVDVLIRAFKQVSDVIDNARLVIVGPHNREDYGANFFREMQKLVLESGLSSKVDFSFYQADIVPYYQIADLFVLPSRQEGLANVLLEAMACGLPVIATDISGSQDLVDQGVNGFLIQKDDDIALAKAIIQIHNNPTLRIRMKQASSQEILAKYSFENISYIYYNLYKNLIA